MKQLIMRGGGGGGSGREEQVLNLTVKIPISRELWIAQPSSDPFQTFDLGSCALVGSSGRAQARGQRVEGKGNKTSSFIHYITTTGSNWLYKNGEWIDSHDTIIRLNADPIEPSAAMQRRGFASFPVGNRTSLRYFACAPTDHGDAVIFPCT